MQRAGVTYHVESDDGGLFDKSAFVMGALIDGVWTILAADTAANDNSPIRINYGLGRDFT